MNIQRCPECGQRLTTNYCDICMRKVPFGGVRTAKRQEPWENRDGSSAHRREKDHECISFGEEKKPKKITYTKPRRKTTVSKKKGASVIAIFIAIMSVIGPLFGLVEDAIDSVAPSPEIDVSDGFVMAGDPGAEDVPAVIAEEIYNANGIRVTADYAGLSYGDYSVFVTIYNDTDQKISVDFDLVSVNGYMVPFGLYQDVKAGKSEQTYLTFYNGELAEAGIERISDVTFEMNVYDENTYEDIVTGELLTIRTEHTGETEPAADITGLELYTDGDFRVVLTDVTLPGYDDCELTLYAENNSGDQVNIYCEEMWINGETVEGYYSKTLRADTRAIDKVYLYELEELNIEELSDVEDISLELYVEYMDGWDILQSNRETVTFAPNQIS